MLLAFCAGDNQNRYSCRCPVDRRSYPMYAGIDCQIPLAPACKTMKGNLTWEPNYLNTLYDHKFVQWCARIAVQISTSHPVLPHSAVIENQDTSYFGMHDHHLHFEFNAKSKCDNLR